MIRFPNPEETTEEGIVAFGADLEVDTLITAYRTGIFPWPIEGLPLPWFCPPERGILEFDRMHIPKSLKRFINTTSFQTSIDHDFKSVINHCARAPRPGQKGTWITPQMKTAYMRLHEAGFAHSLEVWEGEPGTSLVGGIYGVCVEGTFSAESMFFKKTNASKFALIKLCEHLRERGLDWIDIQMVTPLLESLGGIEIPRKDFLKRLKETQKKKLKLF